MDFSPPNPVSDGQRSSWIEKTEHLINTLNEETRKREEKVLQIEKRLDDFPTYSIKLLYKDVKQSLCYAKSQLVGYQKLLNAMVTFDEKIEAILNDMEAAEALQFNSEATVQETTRSLSPTVLNSQVVENAVSTLVTSTGTLDISQRKMSAESSLAEETRDDSGSTSYGVEDERPLIVPFERSSDTLRNSVPVTRSTSVQKRKGTGDNNPKVKSLKNPSYVPGFNNTRGSLSSPSSVDSEHNQEVQRQNGDTCAVCKSGSGSVKSKFGQPVCDTCLLFFVRFLRGPQQYYCKNQGACVIENQAVSLRCRACWLSACLDALKLEEKTKSFINSKYPPKIRI